MSISEPQPRLAVRSVDDLVSLVPYLIGFHPEESLVAMVLQEGRVVVTARVDLAAVRDTAALDALLARLFGRFPTAEGWFLAYTDDEDLAWQVLAGCVEVVGLARLGRLLQVGTTSWRTDCPDGAVGAITGAVSAAAAQAAVLGLPARASRRELAAGIAGPPDAEVDGLVAAFHAAGPGLAGLGERGRRRLLRRLLKAPTPPGRADCVRLGLLAATPEGQLEALRLVHRGNAAEHLERWTQVVRYCPVGFRPSVLGLLGVAAWQTGDGALQVVCLEQLDRIDPCTPLAALLDWLNVNVVPPEEWDGAREPLLAALAADLRPPGPPASRRRR